ncbi:hypothetical protein EI200_22495 [Peribacillus simplex]|uniref:hypothetical protein n=1 Tax=Peribacillus simplex TaxID=1478 RepID=UPI000F6311A0|nr:hypothetical protein [Peribacillus simplex]RRN67555.1 hypothetical protein EI200_22495 [Peribacillus simplex]
MKRKVKLTKKEYNELQNLLKVVRSSSSSPGEKRIAMAKFDNLYKQAARRYMDDQNNNNKTQLVEVGN